MGKRLAHVRKMVAREAATLLYTSQETEYKQAKKKAAELLGVMTLPSNLEIANEINMMANEIEGSSRQELLVQMRKEALLIMKALNDFNPKLVGSVWRGTAHKKSDIDIVVFSQNSKTVLNQLEKNFKIEKTEWRAVTKSGKVESSFHIHFTLKQILNEVEIVVRDINKRTVDNKCEIYGDPIIGLNYSQLLKVLKEDPLQKFLPKRAIR